MKKRLEFVESELIRMKTIYRDRNIPDFIYLQSLRDLDYRYNRFEKKHGYRGLSEWDLKWLEDVFDGKFFDIGHLRFQIFTMNHALIERSDYDHMPLSESIKNRFPEGRHYINIHIVQGASLDPDGLDKTFKEARSFFQDYFSDYDFEYFICRTWLLDESLKNILNPDSKILAFADRFEILTRNFHKGHPLLRIYNSDNLDEIKAMEHKTSLEKKAYLHADQLGVSFGCIPFKQ